MKVTFQQQRERIEKLKVICKENHTFTVAEIKTKLKEEGFSQLFNNATILHYLIINQPYPVHVIKENSFQEKEPFSNNEMDYGTDLPQFKWEELSKQEQILATI